MPRFVQPSFSKGEITPALYGRVDMAAYQAGLKTARNVNIHPHGGASNRDGLRFLEPVKDHSKSVRLIPFEFKTTDQYVLEFGDLYIRVMRNDAHVLDTSEQEVITGIAKTDPVTVTTGTHGYSNGQEVFISGVVGMTEVNGKRYTLAGVTGTTFDLTDQVTGDDIDGTAFTTYDSAGTADIIFEVATPYLEAELFDLTFVQDADVMTICHKNHRPRNLSRTDHDVWTLTEIEFLPGQIDPTGLAITVNTAGAETRRYAVTAIAASDLEESLPGVNNTAKTITGASQTNPVIITSGTHGFANGDEVEIQGVVGMTEINDHRFIVRNKNPNDFELEGEDGTGYTLYDSAGEASSTWVEVTNSAVTEDNTITWTEVAGADKYTIYRRENGIWGLIGESNIPTFDDAGIVPDTSIGLPGRRNPFAALNNPGVVSYFQQRRVFGGSTANPDTTWFSQIGRPTNFNVSFPVADDDAITAGLTSRQVNEIRQYVPTNDLVTFTFGAEWTLSAGAASTTASAVLSPSTLQQMPQTEWGSSYLPALVLGRTIMYLSPQKNRIRSHSFSASVEGYTGEDMLLFSEHLLENDTVVDWAYTRRPETRIHLCLASGAALAFTFDLGQEVSAWSTWDTDGAFESCTNLRGNGVNNEDSIYYVVNRTINGNTVRYIEVWQQRFFPQVEDSFFVDSGLTLDNEVAITGSTAADPVVITSVGHNLLDGDLIDLDDILWIADFDSNFNETQPTQLNGGRFKVANKTSNTFELNNIDDENIDGSAFNAYVSGGVFRLAVTTLSGLDHLEGEAVIALTDGNVTSGLTVSGGSVTLPRASTRVQIGLRYITDIQTLDIEGNQQTLQGKKKKVVNVVVRFRRSRGMLIGPNSDLLSEMKQREFEAMGEPTQLLTGDKQIDILPDWNTNGSVFIRQKEPLPMTILAIMPQLELGDEEE